ncbi:sensor histidine kinase [Kineosporia succinea]|uniref:histidine kinase n=1 Tax=Kineosporia succinea TaxID=84632 RepID=A0ABT9NVB3_9ACTN|nr:PAS domain S-box protein [Kineosporia succinea]MDP9824366.1 PAS domain S-box-containing protein [Kineosporia succinea]
MAAVGPVFAAGPVLEDSPVFDPHRIRAVEGTGLLHRPPVPGLERLTRLAARLLNAPVVLVSLVTGERQVFVNQLGLPQPWAEAGETPLTHSFCQHVVDTDAPLVVTDAREDPVLRTNRAVDDIGVISYAGMPIRLDSGTYGSFCAIAGEPREWTQPELDILEDLAAAVASEIALEQSAREAQDASAGLRAILTATNDAYLSVDVDGVVLEWNPSAERLFGFTREIAVGSRLDGLIVPAGAQNAYVDALFPGLDDDGEGVPSLRDRAELPAIDRHGRTFPVEISAQVTRTDTRPVCHAFVHDISARRADEEAMRRQAELIDAAPAAIVVRDMDGTIRSWNRGAEDMYGWPAQAVIGRNIHRLLNTNFPKGLPEIETALLATGRWQGELRHRRSDGAVVVALSQHVLRSTADGTGHEVIETNTDITERRHAEERLGASERQFRVQFHQATIGQTIIGLDGRFIRVNDAYARMLGYGPDEMIGMRNVSFTHPDDQARTARQLAGLYSGEYDSYEHTKRLVHRDGHSVDAQVGVRLVRDADGQPLHLIGFVQDITAQLVIQRERDVALATLGRRNHQLEDTNSELEDANQLKLDLMGMLSHDIGAPLSTIVGYGEILTEPGQPEAVSGMATKIVKAAQRIDQLRLNVLSMCSRDTSKLQAHREVVPLREALREAVEASDQVVPVTCPEHVSVLVNPEHLQQVVTNFLTNATKYGGGATAVTVVTEPGSATIGVHDNGPGVPADVREHLFERYTRAADAGAGGAAGHGLGLHIVASLAEANGGSVGHHDNQPNGSVFTLRLETTQ